MIALGEALQMSLLLPWNSPLVQTAIAEKTYVFTDPIRKSVERGALFLHRFCGSGFSNETRPQVLSIAAVGRQPEHSKEGSSPASSRWL